MRSLTTAISVGREAGARLLHEHRHPVRLPVAIHHRQRHEARSVRPPGLRSREGGAGDPSPLVIKVRNGAPPFTYFVNGAPIARAPFARAEMWQPDGPGFVTLSVVDRDGKSDRVTVFVE